MGDRIKIGLFGIGLDTYWAQFDGLLNKLLTYQRIIKDRLQKLDTSVTDAGMVDTPQKAINAAELFNKININLKQNNTFY